MNSSVLIQSAILHDLNHSLNGQCVNVLIENNKISKISSSPISVNSDVRIISEENLHLSLGWFDAYSNLPDPGEPWKESIETFGWAAEAAGFTEVAALCGTDPLPEKPSIIESIIQKNSQQKLKLYPLGLASERGEGKEMAEVYELSQSGSIGVTDGMIGGATLSLRSRIMQYCHSLKIPYLQMAYNPKLVPNAEIHEGEISVNLGLKGIPAVSETVEVLASIELSKWLEVPVTLLGISSKESVEIIRNAKAQGVQVSAIVSVLNLFGTDELVGEFDSNYKVQPPLRSVSDREALMNGLYDGTIDGICANHSPEDIENKKVEFNYAQFGAATYDAFAHMLFNGRSNEEIGKIIRILTHGNRSIYGLSAPKFDVGEAVNLTVFQSGEFQLIQPRSKAFNIVLKGETLNFRVVETLVNKQ
jgi:dihydroorotase